MKLKPLGATGNVLWLLCLMYAITYIDRVNVSTAARSFKAELGLNNTEVGLVFSAFAYPYLIFQVIGGYIGDKFGARRVLTLCALIWAGATLATGFVGSLATMLVARFFLGLGEGATFPTATRAMSTWTPKEDRGFAQGITHAAARLGNALTPPLVTWLLIAYTWRGSFWVLGGISLIWALVWCFYFRDNPADHRRITPAEIDALPTFGQPRERVHVPWLPLSRRMLPVTFVYFCYGWTLWLFLSWVPQYFQHTFGVDLKKAAIFAAISLFGGVVGDTAGGVISDWLLRRTGDLRVARRNLVICGFGGIFLSLVPMLLTPSVGIATASLFFGFFFAELCIGPMWAIPMDIAPLYSGTASGLMNTGSALAAIVSPVIGGWIIDATGSWELPFAGSMLLAVIGAGFAFTMHPERSFVHPGLPSVTPTRSGAVLH
jgi:MFS family permease